jgi:tRNA threonylcarbamoyladenosine biosynthesis protein TsaB
MTRTPSARKNTLPVMLALDTSTRTLGLALYNGYQVLSESIWTSHDHHTIELAPAVAEAMQKCGVSAGDLSALAVATGPGSFTGLRIGLALAKGIAVARHLPLIGIPTLDALAAAQPCLDIPMAAILRAGRGRLAVGWYHVREDHWQPMASEGKGRQFVVLTPDELMNQLQTATLICGELTEEERLLFEHKRKTAVLASPAQSLRRPAFLAELAWQRWQSGQVDNPATLSPIYLHYNAPIPDNALNQP